MAKSCALVLGLLLPSTCTFAIQQLQGLWLNTTVGGTVTIKSEWSGKCVDLPGGDASNGQLLQTWDCNGLTNQRWVFDADSWRIQYGGNTGKCIDKLGNGGAGTILGIWDCNGQASQKWGYDATMKTIYLGSGEVDASLCVDLVGGAKDDGTQIQVWGCNGHSNQAWDIGGGGPSPGPSPSPGPNSCVNHLNGLRAKKGLAPVTYNTAKQSCVDWQAKTDSGADSPHKTAGKCGEVTFPDPSGSGWTVIGQCEAQGQSSCEEAIDDYYSEGPTGGHYQVIMSSYSKTMTYTETSYSGQFHTWFTHDFFGDSVGNSTFALI